jgi:hypothetical protein
MITHPLKIHRHIGSNQSLKENYNKEEVLNLKLRN